MKNIDDFAKRINKNSKLFDSLKQEKIAFWGCGNTAKLYMNCFKNENFYPSFFVDSNEKIIHKKFINNIEVISPQEIKKYIVDPIIFIISGNVSRRQEIMEECKKLEIVSVPIDEYIFYKNQNSIIENYNNLIDNYSKDTYLEMIFSRIDNYEIDEKYVTDKQYFCLRRFLNRDKNEVFVDCGAFVGDSLESYILAKGGVFDKIYAFEPDPLNYKALAERIKRINKEWGLSKDKIIIENCGIDNYTHYVSIASEESSVSSNLIERKEGNQIKIDTLDNYFNKLKVSFIKADIESFEINMIEGAKKIIKKNHPLIAVAIYHNASDMYNIQKVLSQIDSSYKFQIRHHTFFECDTVLYAY